MQPSNGLIGDESGTALPQAPVDTTALSELRAKAKYSKSREYQELRAKAEERMEFYKKFLPNGQLVGTASREEMQGKWELANILIAEFQLLFSENDSADELLKETYGD